MKPPGRPRLRRALGRWALALGTLLLLGLVALVLQREQLRSGAEAYLYGYPLVLMDLTREHSARTLGPANQLHRVRRFPDASFKGVVRPNVDTLYTTAFIDMAQGPWVFEMAPNAQRYELMAFLDAWTHVSAAPGTRTQGTAGGRYLLAGPGWPGSAPPGLTLLRAPTRWVWLIGRTQTNGPDDYPLVHTLQDALVLRPLQAQQPAPAGPASPEGPAHTPAPPLQQLQALDTPAFFQRLAMLMVESPPAPADAPMQATLARLGVVPGQPVHWGPLEAARMALARWLAERAVSQALQAGGARVHGWSTPPAQLGRYGTDYALRAAVARVGLGANTPEDALYPQASEDAQGQPLHGRHRYRLHFAPGALPPVRAFWSLTAYGADNFLLALPPGHPQPRHALGSRDALVANADGSVDVWVQAEAPPPGQRANWLPVRADQAFLLTARLYSPLEAALDGRWAMPAVQRID